MPVVDYLLGPSSKPIGLKVVGPPSSDQLVTESVELARYNLARVTSQLPERERVAIALPVSRESKAGIWLSERTLCEPRT